MTQPPTSGRGPGEEPARDSGSPGGSAAGPDRDPRLAGFAEGGPGDVHPPSAELAAVVAELSGPEWRCAGATDGELIGLLGRWDALGSWVEAGKLGVVRELLRRRARPDLVGTPPAHGDLPDRWEEGAGHEVSAALGISLRSADNLTAFAWDLQARLPGIGAALAAGALTPLKARIISDELKVLDDERAAEAEELILDQLDGQTPSQLGKLAARVVCTVDPDGAAKRREHAEREEARVAFWRDNGGACALAAFGLLTDAALSANDAINDRAADYKRAKIRPDARMDQLRVLAFLDILNGITLSARITSDRAAQAGAGNTCGGASDGSTTSGPAAAPILPALTARANLTFPLATLRGLADRPGEGHGLGPLDPALVRGLAAAAANSPYSQWCVTITDTNGVAVAHGCAKPARTKKNRAGYQASDTLKHLVQVRDGTCTFPPCSRHAREPDFEHAIPYDKGGRTCACNGSARSRRCHRVKQSPGWTVTQPQPGWHQWTTPSGRTYTQGPMQYPA